MENSWPTREKDLYAAEQIMQEYAKKQKSETLGLFELFLNTEEKRMNFRLSSWVIVLAEYYNGLYGVDQGDFVTRKVITLCFTNGQTIH